MRGKICEGCCKWWWQRASLGFWFYLTSQDYRFQFSCGMLFEHNKELGAVFLKLTDIISYILLKYLTSLEKRYTGKTLCLCNHRAINEQVLVKKRVCEEKRCVFGPPGINCRNRGVISVHLCHCSSLLACAEWLVLVLNPSWKDQQSVALSRWIPFEQRAEVLPLTDAC